MYGLKKRSKQEGNGLIQGAGTGTSDDIKKNVPTGSYIMPADSTEKIGSDNLKKMGSSTPVHLSNGEFELSPDQVHSVGVQTLDAMKDQTHMPVDQPQLGFKPGQNKPELFFANGGLVSAYPSADDIRKEHAQRQIGGNPIRDVTPINRQLPTTVSPSTGTQPQGATPQQAVTSQPSRFRGAMNGTTAKGLGIFGALSGLAANYNTPSEQYRERFGLDNQSPEDLGTVKGFAKDLGVRGLGFASDIGNAMTLGLAGNFYRDKQAQALKPIQQAQKTPVQQIEEPPLQVQTAVPKTAQKINDIMYGSDAQPQDSTAQQVKSSQPMVTQQITNPYAIQQKGNSFSYSNPNAAAQARANGVPELQSSGFANITPIHDPKGVANYMANVREMGPSQDQINAAINQRFGMQGYMGGKYPTAPQRSDAQEAERQDLIRSIRAPILGARGMTANQRAQLLEMQQGDDNRANARYTTDANNATSQLNNSMNNATSLANNSADNNANMTQTAMREQGANSRAILNENGQNSRFDAQLGFDVRKFNADNGLKNREMNLTETKEGFGIRNSQRVEKLYELYDKASTDEEKQTIQSRINRYTGSDKLSGKDRYMTVGGGQEWNEQAGAMINRPQQLFDTQTQQYLNAFTSNGNTTSSTAFEEGETYRDPETGKVAYYKNGQFIAVN